LSTIVGLAMSVVLPGVFNVATSMQQLAKQLSWLGAAFYLPNAVYGFCFFLLRAGGDTKNAALLDSGYMWVLPVPVAILMGLFGQGRISVILAMLIVQLLMNAKVVIAMIVVRKGKWIRNITQDT
jgi:Na+-driven multidrug efflux pump